MVINGLEAVIHLPHKHVTLTHVLTEHYI